MLITMRACMILVAFMFLTIPLSQVSATTPDSVRIDITRSFHSGELFIIKNEYVDYNVTITNTGSNIIDESYLWVKLLSDMGKTNSTGAYLINDLKASESKSFNVGPFKVRDDGIQKFYLGINGNGDWSGKTENSVDLVIGENSPNVLMSHVRHNNTSLPVDQFTTANTFVKQLLLFCIIPMTIGFGIIILVRANKRKSNTNI